MFHRRPIAPARSAEGQVLVLFALFSFVLIGALALALDVGYLLSERRAAQNAADSAALAAGVALISGEGSNSVAQAALSYVAANDIQMTGPDRATVVVNVVGSQHNGRVEVDLEVPVRRFFVGAIYTGDWAVSARAVSEISDNRDGHYALIALLPPGMYVNGNITVDVVGGSAMSNGNVARSGQANIFKTSGTIDAVGQINKGWNWIAPNGFNSKRPVFIDPYLEAQRPSRPLIPGVHDCTDSGPPSDCTMTPGLYKDMGPITIKRTAHLLPGLYYFENTRIVLESTLARIQGDNVMLYLGGNASSTYFDPGNGEVHLTAPPVSLYPDGPNGMTLWIDNCSNFEARGNGDFYIYGVLYAPCSYVWLHGTPNGETIHGQVIVGELDMRGTSDIVVRYEQFVDTPRHELYLVE